MTELEKRILNGLNELKCRIENGTFRLVDGENGIGLGEPLRVSLDGPVFACRYTLSLEFEVMKIADRIPLKLEDTNGL